MSRSGLILVVLGLLAFRAEACEPCATVERFVDAFNRHAVDDMLALASPELKWMSIDGDTLVTDAAGAASVRAAMVDYFRSLPSARSELRSLTGSGPFVHSVEQAFWTVDGEERSQCSVGIYRIEGGRIAEVWYFPAYACPDPGHPAPGQARHSQ